MISTSKDILYIVLSVAILWLTIFFCWLLYYFVAVMREVRGSMKDFRERMHRVDEAIRGIKEKFEHSVSIFAVMGEAVKQLVGYFVEKKKEKKVEKKK